jgi:acyl transferase domain-containing protein/NAD(P)-dependent dehydrogenase (short-subunit alcohol dehydrogenase family)/acyl carrier protein
MNNNMSIAIIGLDGRFPRSNTLDEFWKNLVSGQSVITEIPEQRWEWQSIFSDKKGEKHKIYNRWAGFIDGVDEFDPLFFNISPAEAKALDPQERLFLETSWNVFEDAGYSMERIANELSSTGVFVGAMYGDYGLKGGGNHHWSIANRVSFFFDLHGPSMAVDSACSSSLLALHLACESIRRGECQQAIAGGVSLILHQKHFQDLCKMKMLSDSDRLSAFGHDADGFVGGEGVGAVLLKSYEQALADGDRIYAVIEGSAVNSGGRTNGYTVPNPQQQSGVVSGGLKSAGIDPADISYIEAHGTGTALGDPIEISGLIKAFDVNSSQDKKINCALGSVKPNIGHLEAAAGIAGLTKVLLQMKHGQLVPSLNCEQENPRFNLADSPFHLNKKLTPWLSTHDDGSIKNRCAGISSFGAGGTNVHIVLKEHLSAASKVTALENTEVTSSNSASYLIPVSAKRSVDLHNNLKALEDFIIQEPVTQGEQLRIADLAYSLQLAKTAFEHRKFFVVSSVSELKDKITQVLTQENHNKQSSDSDKARDERLKSLVEQKGGQAYLYSLWCQGLYSVDMQTTLGKLWVSGVDIDWHSFYQQDQLQHVCDGINKTYPQILSLPRYKFSKKSYWLSEESSLLPVKSKQVTEKNKPEIVLSRPSVEADSTDNSVRQMNIVLSDNSVLITDTVRLLSQLKSPDSVSLVNNIDELYSTVIQLTSLEFDRINILLPIAFLFQDVSDSSMSDTDNYQRIFNLLKKLLSLFLKLDMPQGYGVAFVCPECKEQVAVQSLSAAVNRLPNKCDVSVISGEKKPDAQELMTELLNIAAEDIHYDNSGRKAIAYRQLIKNYPLNEIEPSLNVFKQSVVLINGGLDQLIFDLTCDIARNEPASLIISGVLPLEQVTEQLDELKACNTEIIYLHISPTNAFNSAIKVVNYAVQRFGRLDIVVSCSDTIQSSQLLVNDSSQSLEQQTNLILNTLALDAATANLGLSQFINVTFTAPDQTPSIFFIEEFCLQRNKFIASGQGSGETLILRWHIWKQQKRREILSNGYCLSDAPIEKLGAELLEQKEPSIVSNQPIEVEQQQIRQTLVSILASELEIDIEEFTSTDLDESMSFSEYGVDSIFSSSICKRLSQYTVESISPVTLYNYNTVSALVEHLQDVWQKDETETSDTILPSENSESSFSVTPTKNETGSETKAATKCAGDTQLLLGQWKPIELYSYSKPIDGKVLILGAYQAHFEAINVIANNGYIFLDEEQLLTQKLTQIYQSAEPSTPLHVIYFANDFNCSVDLKQNNLTQIKLLFSTFKTLVSDTSSRCNIAITYVSQLEFKSSIATSNLPLHEGVVGLGKSLIKEYSHLRFNAVELWTTKDEEDNSSSNLLSLISDDYKTAISFAVKPPKAEWNKSTQYKLKQGEVFIKSWEIDIDSSKKVNAALQTNFISSQQKIGKLADNNSYLITGGSSGIGLLFAQYLTKKCANSDIYICSRSQPNTQSQRFITQINTQQDTLEQCSQIIHVQADVTDSNDVARIFATIESNGKPLKGIIHNAGVSRDAMFMRKDWQDIASVIAVKVMGAYWLDHYSAGLPLDFFVMSSSVSSVVGNAGQCDYAFANGFLDGFSQERQNRVAKGQCYGQTSSINWPLWCNKDLVNGMEVPASHKDLLEKQFGLLPLDIEHGLSALQRILEQNNVQTLVLHGISERISQSLLEPMAKDIIARQESKTAQVTNGTQEKIAASKDETTQQAANNHPNSMDIAIVGIAGRFPDADTPDALFSNCLQQHVAVKEIAEPRFCIDDIYDEKPFQLGKSISKYAGLLNNIDQFDAKFFGVMPMEANYIDPQQRLFLQTAWHAFEDANYTKADLNKKNCGVFVGCMTSDYQKIIETQSPPNAFAMLGTHSAALPARLSYWLNLKGPAISVDTACSSSLVALHQACNSLRLQESEMALVSSVYLLTNERDLTTASQAGMMSPTNGCKTFDANADGIAIGEAVTAMVLKPLAAAQQDGDQIYGVIKGSGTNHDGRTSGITAPNSLSQATLLNDIYQRFNVDPATIDYIETHGTGTKLGDPVEFEALAKIFKQDSDNTNPVKPCYLGALKPNVGHAFNAAGMSSLMKVLMAFKYQTIPPVTGVNKVNELIKLDKTRFKLPSSPVKWPNNKDKPMRAGVTALGYAGTNAHIILEAYQGRCTNENYLRKGYLKESFDDNTSLAVNSQKSIYQCTVISGTTPQRLANTIEQLVSFKSRWEKNKCFPALDNLAFSSQVGREQHDYRAVIISCSNQGFSQALMRLQTMTSQQLTDGLNISEPLISDKSTNELSESWGIVTGQRIKDSKATANKIIRSEDHVFSEKMNLSQDWCQNKVKLSDILSESDKRRQKNAIKISLPLTQYDTQAYWIKEAVKKGQSIATASTSITPQIARNSAVKTTAKRQILNDVVAQPTMKKALQPLVKSQIETPNDIERFKFNEFIERLQPRELYYG